MEQFVGLDVSQTLTHLCVLDNNGTPLWQGTCASTSEAIAETIKGRAPHAAKIGLESGPLSTWHWHALNGMGLPVVCLDARHAQSALKMQMNKTDKNDAHGLAQIVRMGWYREVGVKSMESHAIRAMLGVRAQLVTMRTNTVNQIRGTLKTFGVVMGKGKGRSFEQQVESIARDGGMLGITLRALLAVLRSVSEQLKALDRNASACGKTTAACRHLMGIPGVGTLTALAFVTAIDDPARFRKSRNVGAYLGLTPRRYQSGEKDVTGSISRCGDPLVRGYLFEAATVLLTRVQNWSALKVWGLRLAKRIGMKKAKVAVARKLAVIMHRMWITGEPFRWSETAVAPTTA
ncbi:MAG: IS110 family transposase [Acidobacteriaceae bacterium]|nr:IS110 family transposase [Acidobacteriaceae bacterium]